MAAQSVRRQAKAPRAVRDPLGACHRDAGNARVHLVDVPMPPYGMGAVDEMLVLAEVRDA
jgi:hypothetical protein